MNHAKTIKLAVFGQPVAHSLSPRIHRMFGEQLGIAVDYQAIDAGVNELPNKLADFRDEGGSGANLTVPLKEAGIRLCSQVDPAARRARAVNTLQAIDDGWHGYNTDGAGLMLDLTRLGIEVPDRRVLVLGAGGAVAGVLPSLLAARPRQVCLLNRTPARAQRLADKFAHLGEVTAAALADGPTGQRYDVLIQSTSAGHHGHALSVHRDWLDRDAIAYDLNYGLAHTPFSRWCADHELPVQDGLGMLVAQAALAFEIWTSQRPAITPVLEKLRA